MSLVFALAADLHREITGIYRERLDNEFRAADEACSGYLVNKLGRAAGVSAWSLFSGSEVRAYKYASPELVAYWADMGRLTRASFEAQYLAARGQEVALIERNY